MVFVWSTTTSYAGRIDPNPRDGMVNYYGRLNDVIELDYGNDWKIILFDCDWIDNRYFMSKTV